MLKLFLMCGPTGSGKTRLLDNLGFRPWTVSLDLMKSMFSSPVMQPDGSLSLGSLHDELAQSKVMEVVEHRMRNGETTFVDADHAPAQVARYKQLAEQWGYTVNVINVGDPIPEDKTYMSPASFVSSYELEADLEDYTGKYREVVFIGDVHGCAAPLRRLLGKHFDDDKLFIFVGDLFDRGPDNGEVFKMIQALLAKPNVRLICGNHERHILSWLNGRDTPGDFKNNTLPQLFRQGFNRQAAQHLLSRAEHLIQFDFKGSAFQVAHGALADVVRHPLLQAGYQCWRGVGKRHDLIDEAFEQNARPGWYQVHGHSNAQGRVITPGQRSFNLESSVEFGGKLSALSFDGVRFKDISVKSNCDSKAKKTKVS